MRQPTLFDRKLPGGDVDAERIVLYALGDFQSRGKVLAGRDLPLDRLRGAFKRASEAHSIEELSDEETVATLIALGAGVREVPTFVAKHPFRITVPPELAERSLLRYRELVKRSNEGVNSRGAV